ncbi:transposase [Halomicronema sp. CCY15110]
MIQQAQCPHCGETKLRRIRVRGIKQCSSCGTFVDTRRRFWWRKARSA